MSGVQSLSRGSLIGLLVAQALAIAPHFIHLPIWISLLWILCLGWRIQILRMRVGRPGRLAKAALMLAAATAVYLSRGSLVGLDAGVVLLIAAFMLKLVETYTPRDALVMIFLGFFVVVTGYLFNDGILMAVYSLAPVSALLAAMIGLQPDTALARRRKPLRLALLMLLQALPLMLLLFMFFPRLGPLWSLPTASDKAVTGLAESMSPGDIAELSQSDALVLHASFEGAVPPRDRLYWRALTLERFDGRRWSQGLQLRRPPGWVRQGPALAYSVILQPSSQPWMPALDVATTDAQRSWQMSDFRLQHGRSIERPLLYTVHSWPDALREPQATPLLKRQALQLPAGGNPRSRAFADELRRQHGRPEQLVAALLRHFNQQPYVYTLRPPKLGEDSIDEFLFDSLRGFCGHYAGAMTFVLRAAGVPARVVAGYQGGELNTAGNYVRLRQFDAHAWVEYWQPDKGWTSVDPTFQVAPERIESGLREAVADEQSFLENSPFSAMRYGGSPWLSQLRASWDNLDYGWQRWVLNYQAEQQAGLWQRWFGDRQGLMPALLLGAGGVFTLGLLALLMFKPWRNRPDPLQRQFLRLERMLARHLPARAPGEGPQAYATRAATALPEQAAAIEAFAEAFMAQRYAQAVSDPALLRRQLRQLRRRLPWRASRRPLS